MALAPPPPPLAPLDRLNRLSARIRRELADLARRYAARPDKLATEARALVAQSEPALAAVMRDAQILAWAGAARRIARGLPALPPHVSSPGPPGSPPPPPPTLFEFPEDDYGSGRPVVRYPQTVRAVEWVQSRIPFTHDEWLTLDADARQVGFTVAKLATTDAVEKVQAAVRDAVGQGDSLREFRVRIADAIDGSGLSEPQVETIYRTYTGRATTAGQVAVLAHPLVRDEFPYLMYSATHDGRVREEHLAMETLGLNGTAVYRADDPVWNRFLPPWGWNCRCIVIPLSIEDAAEYSVREAIEWERTGIAPAIPTFVAPLPFSLPKDWVPTAHRLSAV